jgi:hypothetical protein
VKRVGERVARGHGAVRPHLGAERADEDVAARQLVESLLDVGDLARDGRCDRGRGELHSRHAARLEPPLEVAIEPADLPVDHLPEALGHIAVDLARLRAKLPAAVALDDETSRDHVVGDGHHEQRIALGAPVDDASQLRREGDGRKPLEEVLADVGLAEEQERQQMGPAAPLEIEGRIRDREVGVDRRPGPVRADQEQSRRRLPPRDQGDQVERGRVTPVEVLEDDNERSLARPRLEQLGHLAQHPLRGGAQQLALERLAIRGVEEPRHLREPRRRPSPQERDRATARVLAAEARQGVEHRQIGFPGPVHLDALPLCDRDARIRGDPREERVQQRRAPDAGLARDEDDLPVAAPRRVEPHLEMIECGPAPDEGDGGGAAAGRGRRLPRWRRRR